MQDRGEETRFTLHNPRITALSEVDKQEKPLSKKFKQFIENIVILSKVKYPKNRDDNESKNMRDVAYYVAMEIEKKYGGSWVVFITKEGSESGSCCVHVNGTHFFVTYEDEIYKIFQSRL